jgi:metal-responsive CopG/Arc/MetJ family transcriptional regulator
MKKDINAIRVEIPTELYEKFKKQLKRDYKSTTSFIKEQIVQYVREGEKLNGE